MDSLIPLTFVLLATGVYCLIAQWADKRSLTLPIFFTTLGWLMSMFWMREGLQHEDEAVVHTLAELTLIIVLFGDASRISIVTLRKNVGFALRMLVIGMPLAILLGTVVVLVVRPHIEWPLALLTAAILTPTDASLGQSFVGSEAVPERVRQTILFESGLNDGLVLPVVLVAAGLTAGGDAGDPFALVIAAVVQIALGIGIGSVIAWIAAKWLDRSLLHHMTNQVLSGIYFLIVAALCFTATELLGGNGFIAAFIGGLVFGNTSMHASHFVDELMESEGQILTMLTFLVFGAVLVPSAVPHMNVTTFAISILFLTIIRMVPMLLSLLNTQLDLQERLAASWFGPRGLASVLFALLILEKYDIPGGEELLACVVMTVGFSVVLHGISVRPLIKYFERRT